MSLLPEVERELLRAARRPVPLDGEAGRARGGQPGQRFSWATWPGLPGAAVVLLALVALGLAGIFLASLHSGRAIRPSTQKPGPGVTGAFPGAPRTQGGTWAGGSNLCPLAAHNRYLPARSGCVTVVRADVDGDGRPDLVLLYGRLSHRRVGGLYVPTSFTLKVVRASGGVLQTRLPAPEANPTIVEAGNVNDEPGVELFIRVARISSGSSVDVYTFHGGRLVRAGPTLAYGGDSALKAGFECRAGHPPTIIQHSFALERGGENGWWRRTDTTYAWNGPALRRIGRRSLLRRGLPPASATQLGVGCGRAERVDLFVAGGNKRGSEPQPRLSGVAVANPQSAGASFRCTAGNLSLALGQPVSPQTGEHADVLVLRNTSNRECAVMGYPNITLSYAGRALPFVYRHGGGPYVTASAPRTVVLHSGGRAYVLVAKYRCDGGVLHAANTIRVAIPASAGALTLALGRAGAGQLDYCRRYPGDQPIDPGNRVTVSPIEPTVRLLQ